MTGFGRGTASADGADVTVELRSVNSRYCEVSVRAPAQPRRARGRHAEPRQGRARPGQRRTSSVQVQRAAGDGPAPGRRRRGARPTAACSTKSEPRRASPSRSGSSTSSSIPTCSWRPRRATRPRGVLGGDAGRARGRARRDAGDAAAGGRRARAPTFAARLDAIETRAGRGRGQRARARRGGPHGAPRTPRRPPRRRAPGPRPAGDRRSRCSPTSST